jgi:hypothetical protein
LWTKADALVTNCRGSAAEAITAKQQANISGRSANVSLVVSLVEPEDATKRKQKT